MPESSYIELATDITVTCQSFREEADNIAKKHGHMSKWTCTQLWLNPSFHEHQHVNSRNAFLKEKLKEANTGRERGDRFILPQYIVIHKQVLLAEYWQLSPTEKHGLIAKVQAAHGLKTVPVCANPKTVNQAIMATFLKMDQDVLDGNL
ncbi:hypothetical protein JVU11DRAFT_6745 [Chiua virens]|nr:hypothetical protein JVU11DRAFT_6745 [Chiua virens]